MEQDRIERQAEMPEIDVQRSPDPASRYESRLQELLIDYQRYHTKVYDALQKESQLWHRIENFRTEQDPVGLLREISDWAAALPEEMQEGHDDLWTTPPKDYKGGKPLAMIERKIEKEGGIPVYLGFHNEPTSGQQSTLKEIVEQTEFFLDRLRNTLVQPFHEEVEERCEEAGWQVGCQPFIPAIQSGDDLIGLFEIQHFRIAAKGWPVGIGIITPWLLPDDAEYGIRMEKDSSVSVGQSNNAFVM